MAKKSKKKDTSSKRKDIWDILNAVAPLITGGVVALFLFFVKDSVDLALKERQLEVTSVTGMRELLVKLRGGKLDENEAEATAIALAAFGQYAVVPLISVLQSGGDTSARAAHKGLQMLALTEHRGTACQAFVKVIENKTQLFSWQTHYEVIYLIGEMNCRKEALEVLRTYKMDVESGGLEAFKTRVAEESTLSSGDLGLVWRALKNATKVLER